MPNFEAKKVLPSGIWTWPPLPTALNSLSASALLAGIEREPEALEGRLAGAVAVRGQDLRVADLEGRVHDLVLAPADRCRAGSCRGHSLKRITMSTLAPIAPL